MVEFNIVFFILLAISAAEFSIQTVISDLSYMVKGAMLLRQPYNKKLKAVSSVGFWRKLFGYAWVIATPIILLVKIHEFISEMLDCPFCIGFHFGWLINYFVLDMPILQALLLAPIVLVFVGILDRLHCR